MTEARFCLINVAMFANVITLIAIAAALVVILLTGANSPRLSARTHVARSGGSRCGSVR
jgi:hypothetical protein